MTPYHAQHVDLFRAIAEILVRDYRAPTMEADQVAEWCMRNVFVVSAHTAASISALIADVEGYERRQG